MMKEYVFGQILGVEVRSSAGMYEGDDDCTGCNGSSITAHEWVHRLKGFSFGVSCKPKPDKKRSVIITCLNRVLDGAMKSHVGFHY